MNAVDRMLSAARKIETARDLLTTAYKEIDAAAELADHAVRYWTGQMRDAAKPCPPSELPDSRLGGPLNSVRDFLRPAPGRPPDPLFDEVVGKLGGPENVRRMLHGATGNGQELWTRLRHQAASLEAVPQEESPE